MCMNTSPNVLESLIIQTAEIHKDRFFSNQIAFYHGVTQGVHSEIPKCCYFRNERRHGTEKYLFQGHLQIPLDKTSL